jgi:hypothetical protein
MAALISRVRILINDPSGASQIFDDQTIQDVMDESRLDVRNSVLIQKPTFSGSTIQFLDYYSELGGWEDGTVFKQYLTVPVTPSVLEPIAGHWQFATTTLPPVYATGSVHDVYRASADLIERWAAKWVLSYNISVDGQSLQRSQAAVALQGLAKTYRLKQRPHVIQATRSDVRSVSTAAQALGANEIDFMGSGDGR